jgi:hypothetical protein
MLWASYACVAAHLGATRSILKKTALILPIFLRDYTVLCLKFTFGAILSDSTLRMHYEYCVCVDVGLMLRAVNIVGGGDDIF